MQSDGNRKLARWVEYQLKSLSRRHPTYLKDTKHLLSILKKLNEDQGPFKMNEIIKVCKDVRNFCPCCDTKKCLDAVKQLLLTRKYNYPSAECILEATGITMTSNSTKFSNIFFYANRWCHHWFPRPRVYHRYLWSCTYRQETYGRMPQKTRRLQAVSR